DMRVVAPVPWWPRALPGPARWRKFAAVPSAESIEGVATIHPRALVVPRVGMASHARLQAAGARRSVRRLAAEFRCDLVEAPYPYPDGAAAAALAREIGAPLLLFARGTDAHTFPRLPRIRPLIASALRSARRVAAVSEGLAREVEALMPAGARVD